MAEKTQESATMDIELFHPITRDRETYGRGVHTVSPALGRELLGITEDTWGEAPETGGRLLTQTPLGRVYQGTEAEARRGVVAPAHQFDMVCRQKAREKSNLQSNFPILALIAFFLLATGALRGQTPTRAGAPDRTYRAAFSVACGGPGDCATVYFSTKTIRVRQVMVQPAAAVNVSLIVRSAVDTGGAKGTTPTAVPLDANDGAATATLAVYTAAPTSGQSVGSIALLPVAINSTWVQTLGTTNTKPVTLEAAGQGLAINVTGAGTLYVNLELTES